MIYNIHAGHAAIGKGAIGAVGLISESAENRRVKDEVVRLLGLLGHTVYDCTVDSGNKDQVLSGIVKKCNKHKVDVDVSIHFNSGVSDPNGDGRTTGVEAYVYSPGDKKQPSTIAATNITNTISAWCGLKNRGVKDGRHLCVVTKTKSPAVLVEVCFVGDKDDILHYDANLVAEAIVFGLTGQQYVEPTVEVDPEVVGGGTPVGDTDAIFRVQVGAYRNKANAEALRDKLVAAGFDAFIAKA